MKIPRNKFMDDYKNRNFVPLDKFFLGELRTQPLPEEDIINTIGLVSIILETGQFCVIT